MPEVTLRGVSKVFDSGVAALCKVDLTVRDKDYVVLLGPSGCGKTTLLKTIAGIYQPTEGSVLIGARNVTRLPIEQRNTGMMFQNYALFPHLSAEKNVAFGPTMRELSPEETREITCRMLELAKFPLERATAMPSQLSGGMQQRVALARALASQSFLLLLDEPLSALDAKIGEELRLELRQLVKKLGLTAIHVTHSQDEAMSTADTIVVMNSGRIMQVGTPEEVYFKPANLFVAGFVGEANFFAGAIEKPNHTSKRPAVFLGKKFDLSKADASRLSGGAKKAIVIFRPEKLVLSKRRPFHRNFVKARIVSRRFMGEKVRYELLRGHSKVIIRRMGFGRGFNISDIVFVSFDAQDAVLFDLPEEPLEKIIGRRAE
jgi:ABC-type Fe3+/spermidine/putrescine transport system ATPase subunit